MKATIKQIAGNTFAAKADSNHWITIDTSPKEGGQNAGSSPMELALMALGACSGIDVLLMLEKMRAKVTDFQINVDSQRAEDPPRVFTGVHLEYVLTGENLKSNDIERAIRLSIEKYCSVAGMISKTAEITTSFRIEE